MIHNAYSYTLELSRRDGSPVGETTPALDWEVYVESVRFDAIRRGHDDLASGTARAHIAPVWDGDRGQPYVRDVAVKVTPAGGESTMTTFPITIFRAAAKEASQELVRRKVLEPGEIFLYRVTARAAATDEARRPPRAGLFRVEAVETRLPILAGDLGEASRDALVQGTPHASDHRVFIPRSILECVTGETRAASGRECGGVLIGHLRRDRDTGDLFAEVTASVPAALAEGDASRLRFTPECWCAVRDAIDRRCRGELILGWYHSHPASERCRECPEERKQRCLVGEFFSGRDRHVHRTVFSRAHSIALVATENEAGEVAFSLYGWRAGEIERRGFHLRSDAPTASPDVVSRPPAAGTTPASTAETTGSPRSE